MTRKGKRKRKKYAIRKRKMENKRRTANRNAAIRRAVMPLGRHGVGFNPKDGYMRLWELTHTTGSTYKKTDSFVWVGAANGYEPGWFTLIISFKSPSQW